MIHIFYLQGAAASAGAVTFPKGLEDRDKIPEDTVVQGGHSLTSSHICFENLCVDVIPRIELAISPLNWLFLFLCLLFLLFSPASISPLLPFFLIQLSVFLFLSPSLLQSVFRIRLQAFLLKPEPGGCWILIRIKTKGFMTIFIFDLISSCRS